VTARRVLAIAAAAAVLAWLAVKALESIDDIDWTPADDRGDLAGVPPFWLDADEEAYRRAVERGG
jgi:hypothetical protein